MQKASSHKAITSAPNKGETYSFGFEKDGKTIYIEAKSLEEAKEIFNKNNE